MPKISIIMPSYNAARTIAKAIDSVHRQNIPDVEIVIADDCSTDGTRDLIKTMAKTDASIKLIELPKNGGASAARNTALDAATGEWIVLLDADDWLEPQRLVAMLKAADDFHADVIYDNLQIYDEAAGATVDRTWFGSRDQVTTVSATMFIENDNVMIPYGMGYLQPMVKRDFLEKYHLRYDLTHRAGEDFIFQLEMLLRGAKVILIPQAYYVYMQRVSPTADLKSLISRSKPGHGESIMRGCDEVLAKYGATMSEAERQALKKRRTIFKSRVRCDQMIAAFRDSDYGLALRILVSRPQILMLNLASIRKMLRTRWLNFQRKINRPAY